MPPKVRVVVLSSKGIWFGSESDQYVARIKFLAASCHTEVHISDGTNIAIILLIVKECCETIQCKRTRINLHCRNRVYQFQKFTESAKANFVSMFTTLLPLYILYASLTHSRNNCMLLRSYDNIIYLRKKSLRLLIICV